tara:strand:+ start:1487 stop:2746 length:1260 start_codon:yes stop_codon:yes gene_type:complete
MADTTTLAESSQAWFSSFADLIGSDESKKIFDTDTVLANYPTFMDFYDLKKPYNIKDKMKTAYKNIAVASKGGVVTIQMMIDFLTENEDWYMSSVLTANTLIQEIDKISNYKIKPAGYQNLFYFRGDESIMGKLSELFKIANNSDATPTTEKFGQEDKWNPADIYLASEKAAKAIDDELITAKKESKSYCFIRLNTLLGEQIKSGDLLPLSLKQIKGPFKSKKVKLEKVNFSRQAELKKLKDITFDKVVWQKFVATPFGTKEKITRDMKIFFKNNDNIKLRHDPSAKRFVIEIEIRGSGGRGGSMLFNLFNKFLGDIDSRVAKKLASTLDSSIKEFNKAMEPIDKQKSKMQKPRYNHLRGNVSGEIVINQVMPILDNWLKNKGTFKSRNREQERDSLIQAIYNYATSRSPLSGKFVIAK